MLIRRATPGDADAIWAVMEPILRAGETYALPRDWPRDAALAYWMGGDHVTFVAEIDRVVVGTYFICANRPGPGAHVANCGYMTSPSASGRGVARAMCRHSLDYARERGFRAMQFNFVVSTNDRAVRLWASMGFAIAGRLPGAFQHPTLGYVDALVMFQELV